MAKKVFAIVLQEPNAALSERVNAEYPDDHFKYSDTFYLVAVNSNVISETIAEKVGIKGKDRVEGVSGVVFKLSLAYSGYSVRPLWEWLDSMME